MKLIAQKQNTGLTYCIFRLVWIQFTIFTYVKAVQLNVWFLENLGLFTWIMRLIFAIVERNTPGRDFRFFHVLAPPSPYQSWRNQYHYPSRRQNLICHMLVFSVSQQAVVTFPCPVLPSLCTSVLALTTYTITIQYLGYTATSLYFNINLAQLFHCIIPKSRNLRV